MNKVLDIQQLNRLILESNSISPSNTGEVLEYQYALELSKVFRQAEIYIGNKKVDQSEIKNILSSMKFPRFDQKAIKKSVNSYKDSDFFKKLKSKNDSVVRITLTGVSLKGQSSADLEIVTKSNVVTRTSLKLSSDKLYSTGSEIEKGEERTLPEEGGGLAKLYPIFDLPNPPAHNINIKEFYIDFNSKLENKLKDKENIKFILDTISRIIRRDDAYIDVLHITNISKGYKDKIIYANLINSFYDHILALKTEIISTSSDLPKIKLSVKGVAEFNPFSEQTQLSSKFSEKLKNKFNKNANELRNSYEQFYNSFKNLDEKQKKKYNQNFGELNLGLSEIPSDFTIITQALTDFVNKSLNSLNKKYILQIRRVVDKNGKNNFIEKQAGLQIISDISEFFSFLESKKEFKFIVNLLTGLFTLSKMMMESQQNIDEAIVQMYDFFYKKLLTENKNKENILNKIKKKINSLNKEDLGIISVTPSNKSEAALVVRCKDKEDIESTRSAVRSAIDDMGISANNRVIAKFEPSTESTEVQMNDGSGGVYIVYKYDIGSREGLALEHVMGLLLTKKVTPELKNRLDLPPEASKEEVKEKLKTDYADVLSTAFKGKKLIDQKIGEITDARSEGSRNSKADLILTTADGHTYGLSIKLVTEQGREVRFTYNKNLGYGDDEEDTLVKSSNGRPWWLIGRQNFAKKLGRQFKGNPEDLEPPSWMTKAKESKSDLYKEAMEETYAALREVFVDNLRRMKLKELVDMVNEAHTGGEQEEEYEKLFVLTSDVDGIRLEAKGHEQPDVEKIKMSGVNKSDIVKTDGARIIIEIPGMSPLTIHGLKFHSNMLSSNREDLKIKTR